MLFFEWVGWREGKSDNTSILWHMTTKMSLKDHNVSLELQPCSRVSRSTGKLARLLRASLEYSFYFFIDLWSVLFSLFLFPPLLCATTDENDVKSQSILENFSSQHNNWHPQINQQEKKIWKTKTRSSDNFIIMSFLHFHFDFFVLWNFQCGKLRHFHLKYSKGDGDAMRNYRSKKKEYGEKQAEIDSKQIFNLSYKTYTPRWSGWFRTELSSIGDEVWTEI